MKYSSAFLAVQRSDPDELKKVTCMEKKKRRCTVSHLYLSENLPGYNLGIKWYSRFPQKYCIENILQIDDADFIWLTALFTK